MKKFNFKILILTILIIIAAVIASIYYFIPRNINNIKLSEIDMKREKLAPKDYIEDFEFVYDTLEKYYPYFEVNKNLNNINRLKNKNYYKDYIGQAINDQDFYFKMNEILMDLNDGHTELIDEFSGIYMYLIYYSSPRFDWRSDLATLYEKEKVRKRYNITNENIKNYIDNYYLQAKNTSYNDLAFYYLNNGYFNLNSSNLDNIFMSDNVTTTDIINNEVAYIKIYSMLNEDRRINDEIIIEEYLEKIKNYPLLLIDLRGNGGGDSRYWQSFLLPKIIGQDYSQTNYSFIKGGKLFSRIISQENYHPNVNNFLENSNFPNKTIKILDNFDYYTTIYQKVSPSKNSINYKGKIYLLVDENVFSSSEMLASFAKETGFATLIGEKTRGAGIGSDPMQVALPNTGYIMRFSKEIGTNSSGEINEIEKTNPDIEVDSSQEKILEKQAIIKKILELENY